MCIQGKKLILISLAVFAVSVVLFISELGNGNGDGHAEQPPGTYASCVRDCSLPDTVRGKLTLFILAGQSNMSGRGRMKHYPDRLKSHPRAFLFGNDAQWKPAYEPHDDAIGQIDRVSEDRNAGASMAMSFAIRLLEHDPDMYIGLVPCSMGGTVIEQWQKNLSPRTLYGSCLNRAREAMAMGQIGAILFAQGESDARDPDKNPRPMPSPHSWAKKFTEFATDFRSDLGLPKVPLLYTQIGRHKDPKFFRYWESVQKQQAAVALPNTYMIKTRDLPLKDYVHYTTQSYITLGERFADKFIQIKKKQP